MLKCFVGMNSCHIMSVVPIIIFIRLISAAAIDYGNVKIKISRFMVIDHFLFPVFDDSGNFLIFASMVGIKGMSVPPYCASQFVPQ